MNLRISPSTAYQNDAFHEVSKADVLGHWSVFFFYPADFTFVCPTELEDLAAKYDEFKAIGCEIYSVVLRHPLRAQGLARRQREDRQDPVPELADPTAALARDLDTYNEALGQAERGDFIVNPEGKVVAYEVHLLECGPQRRRAAARVQASQFVYEHGDQVCPAKWAARRRDHRADAGSGRPALIRVTPPDSGRYGLTTDDEGRPVRDARSPLTVAVGLPVRGDGRRTQWSRTRISMT